MGGCRCAYRKCKNSTTVSPGLHYFHFPIRDPARCELWIQNAHRPAFRDLEKDKLRNKVVCSVHFETKCFTNQRRDRLIHSAVPTLNLEDDDDPAEDPLETPNTNYQCMEDDNIMLIPMDEDNTKFALPNVEFSGMSYTIFDDAVIPTSKIEEVIIKELHNNSVPKPKELQIKTIVKKIKTNIPAPKKVTKILIQQENQQQFSNFIQASEHNQQLLPFSTPEPSNNNISSYSVTTSNGDISVAPSTHILPDILTETIEEQLVDFPNDQTILTKSNVDQNSSQPVNNNPVQIKCESDYSVSVNVMQNMPSNENSQEPTVEQMQTMENIQNVNQETVEEPQNDMQKEYIQMIENNTKQIKQLKRLVQKQNKMYRTFWQKKQMPHMKPTRLTKTNIIEALKTYVKPSLLAILKFELLPGDEVVLNDNEEKFIIDLYTENRDCYNLLRDKFKWNLPVAEQVEDSNNMKCE